MTTLNKIGVFGPSHIMRIIYSINSSILPKFEGVDYIGRGGMPIWHEMVNNNFDKYDKSVIILNDFRFGNKAIGLDKGSQHFYETSFHMSKDMINHTNDQYLYDRSLVQLTKIVQQNKDVIIIPWDLHFRERENVNKNKYVDEQGVYWHPIWNYKELENAFPNNIISLSNVDDTAVIDSSNHPSISGYSLLYFLIHHYRDGRELQKIDIGKAFDRVKRVLKRRVNSISLSNVAIVTDSHSYSYRQMTSFLKREVLPDHRHLRVLRYEDLILESSYFDKIIYLTDYVFENKESILELLKRQRRLEEICETCHVILNRYNFISLPQYEERDRGAMNQVVNENSELEATSLEHSFSFILKICTDREYTRSFYELVPSFFSFKGYIYLLWLLSSTNLKNSMLDTSHYQQFDMFYKFFMKDYFNELSIHNLFYTK